VKTCHILLLYSYFYVVVILASFKRQNQKLRVLSAYMNPISNMYLDAVYSVREHVYCM
jgi:hypothetical protein